MTQAERLIYLIEQLCLESPRKQQIELPDNEETQKQLLRSLFNLRPPLPVSNEFLQVQDDYLQEETKRKGITTLNELTPLQNGIYLWQGDITTLKADAIVNAANNRMLGCFYPCHGCIDNAIHTYAGVQLRLACADIMKKQGHDEPMGHAKITPAFNLPCKYVLHTVGPVVTDRLVKQEVDLLTACYVSCLNLAEEQKLNSIAFCCISTGEYHFPNDEAAQTAIQTVQKWKLQTNSHMEVIFNVYKQTDYNIYRRLL